MKILQVQPLQLKKFFSNGKLPQDENPSLNLLSNAKLRVEPKKKS